MSVLAHTVDDGESEITDTFAEERGHWKHIMINYGVFERGKDSYCST